MAKQVLIVEDEPSTREAIKSALGHFSQLILQEATTLDQVKSLEQADSPDLVILDLTFFGLKSLDFIVEIKRKKSSTAVIGIMEKIDNGLGKEALKEGAWACLPRPIETDKLKNLIDLWLRISS